jgi:hypothetical protein
MALGYGYVIRAFGYCSLFLTGVSLIAAATLLFWAYVRVPCGDSRARLPPVQHGRVDRGVPSERGGFTRSPAMWLVVGLT